MWNAFKEPLVILLFQPLMAEEPKETAGHGWRQSVLSVLGKNTACSHPLAKAGWTLPMEVPLAGLLLSEPQNNVSWIWACKTHSHTAFSDHVCSGFRSFCTSPTFQVLKIFHLSYVTSSAALSSQSSLQLSSFPPFPIHTTTISGLTYQL